MKSVMHVFYRLLVLSIATAIPAAARSDDTISGKGVFQQLNGRQLVEYADFDLTVEFMSINNVQIIESSHKSGLLVRASFDDAGNGTIQRGKRLYPLKVRVFGDGYYFVYEVNGSNIKENYRINSRGDLECFTKVADGKRVLYERFLLATADAEGHARSKTAFFLDSGPMIQASYEAFEQSLGESFQTISRPAADSKEAPVTLSSDVIESSPGQGSLSTQTEQQAARHTTSKLAAGSSGRSGHRVALVIGNSTYDARFGSLANPASDARAMAVALTSAGFHVELVANADQKGMKRAISRFGQRLVAAGPHATGLFFYAGHGVQAGGTNYLVPLNAAIDTEADVDLEAVSADSVMAQMEAAHSDTSIVILDACRNMPLARTLRDGTRGLARMDAPNGSFVAYSTAPGATAADGSGTHSPFVAALLTEINKPGEDIQTVFLNVRRAVFNGSGGSRFLGKVRRC